MRGGVEGGWVSGAIIEALGGGRGGGGSALHDRARGGAKALPRRVRKRLLGKWTVRFNSRRQNLLRKPTAFEGRLWGDGSVLCLLYTWRAV